MNADYNNSPYVSDLNKPITAWGFVGYTLLFAIPLIGQIILICFAIGSSRVAVRSYARSYFCWILLGILITVALPVMGVSFATLSKIWQGIIDVFRGLH